MITSPIAYKRDSDDHPKKNQDDLYQNVFGSSFHTRKLSACRPVSSAHPIIDIILFYC